MARDPNGRFDTALAFGNAIRNSVATLGGPATPGDLARLLFTDFGDEMSARDEILKAADDPARRPGRKPPKPAAARRAPDPAADPAADPGAQRRARRRQYERADRAASCPRCRR